MKKLDWNRIRERLDVAQRALAESLSPSESQVAAVYRQRADARPVAGGTATVQTRSVLTFRLGSETFAIDLHDLAEVIKVPSWARVPGAPAEVLGAINVRGDIRLLADLGRLLDLPGKARDGPVTVLLLRHPEIGLAVEEVEHLTRVPITDLQPAQGAGVRFVQAVTSSGLRLLSAEQILTHPVLGETR